MNIKERNNLMSSTNFGHVIDKQPMMVKYIMGFGVLFIIQIIGSVMAGWNFSLLLYFAKIVALSGSTSQCIALIFVSVSFLGWLVVAMVASYYFIAHSVIGFCKLTHKIFISGNK